ncbi:MAG: YsnF/AvaK domain-containing protein [Cyclobacteriaceae bacterium]
MSNTVVGIFENRKEAVKAVDKLLHKGFSRDEIDISSDRATEYNTDKDVHTKTYQTGSTDQTRSDYGHLNEDNPRSKSHTDTSSSEDGISRFFNSLFGSTDKSSKHAEVGRRGSIVTVHASSHEEAKKASAILDENGSVDVDERAEYYRSNKGTTDVTKDTSSDKSIPVVEEEMQTGKREVETGGVRVRSHIVEKPVEEHLRLREEHVHVERNPVDRPATEADFDNFEEGEIEMRERSEKAVTSKEARVKEEVRLRKDVEERDETIRDTVRGTEVETEKIRDKDRGYKETTDSGNVTNENRTYLDNDEKRRDLESDKDRAGEDKPYDELTDEEREIRDRERRRNRNL